MNVKYSSIGLMLISSLLSLITVNARGISIAVSLLASNVKVQLAETKEAVSR